MEISQLRSALQGLEGACDFVSLRYVETVECPLFLEKGILESPNKYRSTGVMVNTYLNGGFGYAATADLSFTGIKEAFVEAKKWAEVSSQHSVIEYTADMHPAKKGSYRYTPKESFFHLNISQKIELLNRARGKINKKYNCVHDSVSLQSVVKKEAYVNSNGAEILQEIETISPDIEYTVANKTEAATRSLFKGNFIRQGGVETLEDCGFFDCTEKLLSEAVEVLNSPKCPSDKRDIIILPSQLMLQIHESIGHPLELDRILGDERNFAGTSFVAPEMFGRFQYGSEHLNISFDPTVEGQVCSYNYDDDGLKAEKVMLIENGILKRGIGGKISQMRSGIPGTASTRAVSWDVPTMDRMGNINLEPGDSTLDEMIASVEKGILVGNNVSWSIDDSRNKFQFGCEWGRLIEKGELKGWVKNPNYRGISQNFWRSLKAVGHRDSISVLGTPYCGKGEPGQTATVGHATPPALFSDVEVFGE